MATKVNRARPQRFGRGFAHRMAQGLACGLVAAALAMPASAMAAAGNLTAQASGSWDAPDSAQSVDDGVVTVGAHGSSTATAELLGLNGVVVTAAQANPTTLAQARETDRLGVFGSAANENPNPYLANMFYNLYADSAGLQKSQDAAVLDTTSAVGSWAFNPALDATFDTTSDLALRPDIVLGISGSPAAPYTVSLNQNSTTAVNYSSWGSGLTVPSQPYLYVLEMRRRTNDASLVGTVNSDSNAYELSEYYREGDESFDPIGALYDRGAQSATGIDVGVENANNLAWAAKLAMQQDAAKGVRYGDPLAIANRYELFVKAIKWNIISKIEGGSLQKKTVAVVARVRKTADSSTGAESYGFTLAKMNPDGSDSLTGSLRVLEAAQDTVDDLAAKYFPTASADLLRNDITAEQLMEADVIVCLPPIADSYDSSAQSVRNALAASGYTASSEGYPAIFDNVVPDGTFKDGSTISDSVEAAMYVGLVQGFIYPEAVNPIDAMAYYASKLYHLKDEYVGAFVRRELSGVSLPSGVSLASSLASASAVSQAVARVQDVIDAGDSYYFKRDASGAYARKNAIDAARPRIASTDALDDARGCGVTDVNVRVPAGASTRLVDNHGLEVKPNGDGTYTLDDDNYTGLTVSCPGYRDYQLAIKGTSGDVTVAASDMTAVKTVTINVPEGATVAVKNASNRTVKANEDGTFTLDAGVAASFTAKLAGYDDYEGVIAGNATTITLAVSDFTPESTATTINVPVGATLVVVDSSGAAVKPGSDGTYRLYNGYAYTLKVSLERYEPYTRKIVGGESATVNVRKANMTAYVGHTELTLNKATVTAADINIVDAEMVQTITLGSSVKTVAAGAFKNCVVLRTVKFGANVTSVGSSAFAGLTQLSTVKLDAKLASIGASAFSGCMALKSVAVPAKVKTVGASAFAGCTSLWKAQIGAGCTSIGKGAFSKCTSLRSLSLGSGLKTIGASAFSGCTKLPAVVVPAKVTSIGASAFSGCTKLAKATLGAKVATVGTSAFANCKALVKLIVPAATTTLGSKAFSGCTKLAILTLKTTKLAKAKVKGSLSGSSVKTVKVSLGGASANKTYVKKYKKIFTKANAGKKVTVA